MLPEIAALCPLIQVFDMPVSLGFYRDILGMEMVGQSSPGDQCDWAWLKKGTAELMLNTLYESDKRPAQPDPVRSQAHGDTILYLGAPDVEAMYHYLKSKGLEVSSPRVQPYGMKQIYLKDPDGYGICFQWREGSG